MLSKIIGSSLLILAVGAVPTAEAHKRHQHSSVVKINVGWVWVTGVNTVSGHWFHPRYGKSYRAHHIGPPNRRPHARAVWVPGHWVGPRHHRRWVQGHWRR